MIVCGGLADVKLSGALAEVKTDSYPFRYPELNFAYINIYLLEGIGKLLSAISEVSSQKAKDYLQKSGVTIMLKTIVKEHDRKRIMLQDATIIKSTFVIWAACVKEKISKSIKSRFYFKIKLKPIVISELLIHKMYLG